MIEKLLDKLHIRFNTVRHPLGIWTRLPVKLRKVKGWRFGKLILCWAAPGTVWYSKTAARGEWKGAREDHFFSLNRTFYRSSGVYEYGLVIGRLRLGWCKPNDDTW